MNRPHDPCCTCTACDEPRFRRPASTLPHQSDVMVILAGPDAPPVMAPAPLPPSSPRLRAGRFEVVMFGPKDPTTTARPLIAGPFRFASTSDANAYAETLAGGLVSITNVRPQHPRYPDGPWRTTLIAEVEQ